MEVRYRNNKPELHFTREAWEDMLHIVALVDKEVAWYGHVERKGELSFLCYRIDLPEQETTGTTTEVKPDYGLKYAQDLIRAEGHEVYNNVRLWGHSHVNMGVAPSSQDQKMIDSLAMDCGDYYLAIRINKRSEAMADLALPEVTYQGISIFYDQDERRQYWAGLVKERVRELKFEPKKPAGLAPVRGVGNHDLSDYYGSKNGYVGSRSPAQQQLGLGMKSDVSVEKARDWLNGLSDEQVAQHVSDWAEVMAMVDEDEVLAFLNDPEDKPHPKLAIATLELLSPDDSAEYLGLVKTYPGEFTNILSLVRRGWAPYVGWWNASAARDDQRRVEPPAARRMSAAKGKGRTATSRKGGKGGRRNKA